MFFRVFDKRGIPSFINSDSIVMSVIFTEVVLRRFVSQNTMGGDKDE